MKLLIFNNSTSNNINNLIFTKSFDFVKKYFSENNEFENLVENDDLNINLILTTEEEVKKLNKKWRGKDKTTDVLSFPYEETFKGTFGEIFISIPQCIKQAKTNNVSTDKELQTLFIHGVLHLFGYDHIEEADYIKMKEIEDRLLYGN